MESEEREQGVEDLAEGRGTDRWVVGNNEAQRAPLPPMAVILELVGESNIILKKKL